MSNSNSRRRAYRRFSDERIWREFFAACLPPCISAACMPREEAIPLAGRLADEAYAEYRDRFSVRQPELTDDEPETEAGVRPQ